jgi:hypothetical protein
MVHHTHGLFSTGQSTLCHFILKRICSKANMECIFSLLLQCVLLCFLLQHFDGPKEVAPSDWTLVVLPALPRLRAAHRVAVSFAALNKQTNKQTNTFCMQIAHIVDCSMIFVISSSHLEFWVFLGGITGSSLILLLCRLKCVSK